MENAVYNGWTQAIPKEKKGISGSTLKLIAIIVMLIDHIGAVIVERMVLNAIGSGINLNDMQVLANLEPGTLMLLILDMVLRYIGRLGFPIFCFLLIEGFLHTRNVWKYAFRLFMFALISEIPFNLAFTGRFFYLGYQNVFFTLLIGLLVMIAYSYIEKKTRWKKIVRVLFYIISFLAGMAAAQLLMADYAAMGVFCIMMIYIFRKKRWTQVLAGCLSFAWEFTAPLAFIPIACYNGKRGMNLKYAFYIFYPLHLFILYLIVYFMGMAPWTWV